MEKLIHVSFRVPSEALGGDLVMCFEKDIKIFSS